jgi:outer membrane protein OmpA-like peptidoglycan-associated protein
MSSRKNIVLLSSAGLLLAAFSSAACGGTTVFSGNSGTKIVGDLPPLPPPPPPPPPKEEHAKIVENKIVIDEKIQFEYDKAIILPVSFGILDDVVKVMQDNPKVKKVRVEGHASDEGHGPMGNQYNKALSDKRAHAVMDYLVSKGVDRSRLEAHGYGVEKPISDNKSEEGREKNRRVEFNILDDSAGAKE